LFKISACIFYGVKSSKPQNYKKTSTVIILFFGMHTGWVCAQTAIFISETVSKNEELYILCFVTTKKTEN
jgi:hypothetical protein